MKYKIYCLLIVAVLAGLATAAFAQSNLYVATTGDDAANSGQSWASPYATISNGIAHASTVGDTVWVSNGTYVLSAALSITRAITVSAWSASAADTSIDGDGAVRCVSISAAATLVGFTVSNGAVSGDGGGLSLANASCVVTNCIITRNQTTGGNGRGGGIYVNPCGKVTDCVISHNVSLPGGYPYGGGGLWCQSYGNVFNCQFISNTVYSSSSVGGGIGAWNPSAAFVVSNCVFDGNIASIGGGIVAVGSYCQTIDCTFSNNTATNGAGGGFYANGGIISNCVFVRNQTTSSGGGIYMGGGTGVNCVISENLASGFGAGGVEIIGGCSFLHSTILNNTNLTGSYGVSGGVYMRGTTTRSTLRNCLIAGNVVTGSYSAAGVLNHGTDGTNSAVQNCTIVFNRATAPGTGNIGGVGLSTNSFDHYGNIIYYNTGVYKANWNDSDVPNFYVLNTCITPTNSRLLGTGNITNAPMLIDTNSANYRLAKGSPCINTGLNQDWMIPPGSGTVDLDDRVRIRYGTVDMGAYEAIYNAFIFTAY